VNTEIEWDDIRAHIDEAIAALPGKLREPIIHRFLEGQTHEAIAQNLGVSRSTVQYRLAKGVDAIRNFLKRRGVVVPAAVLSSLLAAHLTAEAAPAALTAALGTLALASASGAVGTSATGIATLGGALVVKKIVLVAAMIVVGGFGIWVVKREQPPQQNISEAGIQHASLEEGIRAATPIQVLSHRGTDTILAQAREGQNVMQATKPELPAISGRIIVSETGEPLSGVKAVADGPERHEAFSAKDGGYLFEGLEPGDYRLACKALDGVVQMWLHKNVSLGQEQHVENVDFSFKMGIRLSGRVTDTAMHPIEGAELKAESRSRLPWVYSKTTTDSEGRYKFRVRQNDSFHITAAMEDYGSIISDAIEIARIEDVTGVDFVLEPGAVISGYAVDTDGNPVADSTVRVNLEPRWMTHFKFYWLPEGKTDHRGRFEIRGVPPGTQYFFVVYQGVLTGAISEPVTVRSGQRVHGVEVVVEADPEHDGFVEGFVRNAEGEGIPGVWVRTSGLPGHYRQAEADDSGHFLIHKLAEGEVDIEFRHREYATVKLRAVPVWTPDLDVVMDPRGAISGTVVDSHEGTALTEFTLEWDGNPRTYHSETGEFMLANVEPGNVTLEAFADGYARQRVSDIVVESGKRTSDVVVQLSPGSNVRGTVVSDVDLRPIADATIYLGDVPDSLDEKQRVSAVTNMDGVFVLEGLAISKHRLAVTHPEFVPKSFEVDAQRQGAEVTVRLQRGGTITGFVTRDGQPVSDAIVHLERFTGQGGGFSPTGLYHVETNEDGLYELKRVPAGDCELSVQEQVGSGTPGHVGHTQYGNVEVQNDCVTELDFEFITGDCAIEGYLTSDGQPALLDRFATVYARPVSGGARSSARPYEGGSYRIDGLLPDAYNVYYWSSGEESAVTVEVGEGETVRQDIELAR
jgi:hypothetical protein